jgi:hypothetical protein
MKLLIPMAALLALAFPLSSRASLIGDTVTCTQTGPSSSFVCTPPAAVVVDPGSEFVLGNATASMDVDVGAFDILLTALFTGRLGNTIVEFGSLDAGGPITGVTLSVGAGVTGLAQSDVTFSADSIGLDLRNTNWIPQGTATLSLAIGQAPEPATFTLLGIALAGLAFSRCRRAAQ